MERESRQRLRRCWRLLWRNDIGDIVAKRWPSERIIFQHRSNDLSINCHTIKLSDPLLGSLNCLVIWHPEYRLLTDAGRDEHCAETKSVEFWEGDVAEYRIYLSKHTSHGKYIGGPAVTIVRSNFGCSISRGSTEE
jgi:hypothetical protein